MSKSKYKLLNWSSYNLSLINRGNITFWIDENIARQWYASADPNKRGKQYIFSDLAIETVLNIKNILNLPLRALEGFLNSLFKKMNLNIKCPNYTSISKRAKNLKIKIKSYGTKNINHIAIDSTSLKVFGEGEWKVRQHGIGKRRTWKKSHLGLGVNNHQIMSAFLSKSNIHDREKFEDLVYSIDSKINEISADGAYDDKGCYEVIQNVGAKPLIPPRANSVFWEQGHPRNNVVLQQKTFKSNDHWKKESGYHKRSISETAMFRYKTLISRNLSFRNFSAQENEAISGINVINKMASLGMPKSYRVA